jgi:hypothetical protein
VEEQEAIVYGGEIRRIDMFDTLESMLAHVATLRDNVAAIQAVIQEVEQRIAQSEDGKALVDLQERLSPMKSDLKATEDVVRLAIVKAYQETGSKSPAPGATVKVFKGGIALADQQAALAWAKVNMPVAVIERVDEAAVLNWAEAQEAMPEWAVRHPDRPQGQLAKDLSSYLEG